MTMRTHNIGQLQAGWVGYAYQNLPRKKKVEIFKISSQRIWICPPLLHPCKNVVTRQLPRISRSQQISEQERATIAWTQQLGPNHGSPTVPMVKDPTAWARWMISHPFLFLSKSHHLSEDIENTEANLTLNGFIVRQMWDSTHRIDACKSAGFSKGTCWTCSGWYEIHWLKEVSDTSVPWVKHKVAEMKLDLSSDQLVWDKKKNLASIALENVQI